MTFKEEYIRRLLRDRRSAIDYLAQAEAAGRDFNKPEIADRVRDVEFANSELRRLGYLKEKA